MAPLGSPSNHRAHEQARRTNLWQRSAGARAFTPRGSTADHRTVRRRPAGDHQETPPTLELKARASVGGQVKIDRSKTRAAEKVYLVRLFTPLPLLVCRTWRLFGVAHDASAQSDDLPVNSG